MANGSLATRLDPFGFFGWWLGELAGLVPGVLRRGFRRGGRILLLDRQGAELAALQRLGGREREIVRIDQHQATERERQRFGRRLARAARRADEIVLRLSPDEVLERHLQLPLVADADLRNALYFEIDRQSPFRPEETYYDYQVTSRRPDEKQLSVDLTIVPRKVVAGAEAGLAEWQVAPDAVEVWRGAEEPPVRVDLRPASEARGGIGFGAIANLLMLLVLLAELTVAVQIPLEARRQVAEKLNDDVQRARARAETAIAMRKELDATVESMRALQKRKLETASSVAVLDEVTRRLPDEVWLTNLQLDGGEVRLTGYAPTAASLIGVLDASERFQTPSFRSPVTQDSRLGKERFTLTFQLEPKPAAVK